METLAHLLTHHAMHRPHAVALREKALGIWQETSWLELEQSCARLACGLQEAGLKTGEHLAVIGGSRPRLITATLAAQMLGAIPVVIHPDTTAQDIGETVSKMGLRFAVVEDQEQVDKVLEARRCSVELARIFHDKVRGLRGYRDAGVSPLDDLVEQGAAYNARRPGFIPQQLGRRAADEVAVLLLPSGGMPAAAGAYTNRSLLDRARASARSSHLDETEEVLCFDAPATIGQYVCSQAQWLTCGFVLHCPEGVDTTDLDLRDVGPTYIYGPPRMFGNILAQVTSRMASASGIRRMAIESARVSDGLASGGSRRIANRVLREVARLSVYAPLRNALGLARVRVAQVTDGNAGDEVSAFFRGIGIPLHRTEATDAHLGGERARLSAGVAA